MTLSLPAVIAAPEGSEAVAVVAQQPGPTPGGQGEDFGKSSPVALVVILLFFLAVVLLVRSMNKHLRRVPKSFDRPDEQAEKESGPDDSTQK